MTPLQTCLCRLAFNPAERRRVWRKLSIQAQNGLAIEDSLNMLGKHAKSARSPLALLFAHIIALKDSGLTLEQALAGWATPEEIQLIASGQATGKLPEALLMAVDLLEAKEQIRTAVIGVVAYPSFLIALCVVILLVIALMVIPELALISDPQSWRGMAGMLYTISSFASSWQGGVFLLLVLAISLVVAMTLPLWTGPMRRQFESLPPWSVYRMIVGSTWLYTIATLMQSGLPLKQVMVDTLQSSQTTPYLRERVHAIFVQQSAGNNIGKAMYTCGMGFPDPEVINELRTYATLPNFDSQLLTIARQWMFEGIHLIKQRSQVLSVVCMLFVVVLVCALGMAIMDMQSQMMNLGG